MHWRARQLKWQVITVLGVRVYERQPPATTPYCVDTLAINLVVPTAIILLEVESSKSGAASAPSSSHREQVLSGLKSGLKSPLLWAPVLGIVAVLGGVHIPKDIASCFEMIGSATSGVAVFTVGLTLAVHLFRLSKTAVLSTIARVTVQTSVRA